MLRVEREMGNLQGQYRLVERNYGQDVLTLVLVRGYLVKLLANQEIGRFMRVKTPEILEQFETIAAMTSLENSPGWEGAHLACVIALAAVLGGGGQSRLAPKDRKGLWGGLARDDGQYFDGGAQCAGQLPFKALG